MRIDWSPLDQELALWTEAGLTLPFWWRDDDAVAPSPALARLAQVIHRLQVDLHLAVIPGSATEALSDLVASDHRLVPMVHGWTHTNHAPQGSKKAEFGADRATSTCLSDARSGLRRMQALFGTRRLSVFVPPWNRIAPQVVAGLAGEGFSALSCFGSRQAARPHPGLLQINTHCDPIDWHGSHSLIEPDLLLRQTVATLAGRRIGTCDQSEPFGLLTHHLVHDEPIWGFCEEFVGKLLASVARPAQIGAIVKEG